MAVTLLLNLSGFQQATSTLKKRYFDGEEIMFLDSLKTLADLEKYTNELVITFNNIIIKES
jgi:hypothetical protein